MDRSNHYEAAFEAYLQWHRLGYIAVDESRRSLFGDTPVKSLDFLVFGSQGARLVVDVKGRRFPTGRADHPRHVWECWSTQEDIEGLERWAELSGPGWLGLMVFAYHVLPSVALPNDVEDLWTWRGQRYLLRAVEVADYREHMRVRSPRWQTVTLPRADFRELVKPLQQYTHCVRSAEHSFEAEQSMNRLQIGLRLESLNLPLRRALTEAARLAVAGVQVDAAGDLSPAVLSDTGRREFRTLLRLHNVELTVLGCPLRHGLDTAENQQPRLEHIRKVMSLCSDLGARVVIIQAGRIPSADDDPRLPILTESLTDLARYGDRIGALLALETGSEPGEVLRAFLSRFDTGSLGANLDPANLLMNGFDPYEGARALSRRIVHSHAKDARIVSPSRAAQEVPLGHGDIDWLKYLSVLEEVEYRGWLTIERESGESRLADVAAGVAFLRRVLP